MNFRGVCKTLKYTGMCLGSNYTTEVPFCVLLLFVTVEMKMNGNRIEKGFFVSKREFEILKAILK